MIRLFLSKIPPRATGEWFACILLSHYYLRHITMEIFQIKTWLPSASLLMLLLASGCQNAPLGSGQQWERQPDSLALRRNGQIIWRFNFGPDESKPNFHPLALPDGPDLSCYRPKDHPWHRGLWFSWKYINNVNYWEENRKTGLAQGKTDWPPPLIETHADFSVRLVMDLRYHPTNGPIVLTEHRVIQVSPPDQAGAYYQDWDMTFRAVGGEIVLDRAPPIDEKGNNVSGGYAGLGLRVAQELQDAQVITAEGAVKYENHRFRGKSPALDFSGLIGGRMAGVAFLDNSANLNSPTPWYVINNSPMYYISPAVLTYAPYTLKAGQTLNLRYRVVVHPDRWTPDQLRQAIAHYQAPPQKLARQKN
jgi:hypothetical protein